MAKPSRDFPLRCCLLIALSSERDAGAKLSGGFPLEYHLFIALAFERGAVVRLSRHNQVHRLTVKRLGCVDSRFVSPFDSRSGLTRYRKYPLPDLYPETYISEEYVQGIGTIKD